LVNVAADNHFGTSHGLWFVHAQSGPERPRRRNCRSGKS